MKICALADFHNQYDLKTPKADILAIAGDLTGRGTLQELARFRQWLREQPQKHKIIIAGNHDFCFQNDNRQQAENMMGGDGIVYLRDQLATIEGLKIYGSPWQPWFYNWAFNLQRGEELAQKWAQIPFGVDLLMVHGPPFGYGDLTYNGTRVGCADLLEAIKLKQPRTVIYGHIHENRGDWQIGASHLCNCSVGPNYYNTAKNPEPVVFELEPGQKG